MYHKIATTETTVCHLTNDAPFLPELPLVGSITTANKNLRGGSQRRDRRNGSRRVDSIPARTRKRHSIEVTRVYSTHWTRTAAAFTRTPARSLRRGGNQPASLLRSGSGERVQRETTRPGKKLAASGGGGRVRDKVQIARWGKAAARQRAINPLAASRKEIRPPAKEDRYVLFFPPFLFFFFQAAIDQTAVPRSIVSS